MRGMVQNTRGDNLIITATVRGNEMTLAPASRFAPCVWSQLKVSWLHVYFENMEQTIIHDHDTVVLTVQQINIWCNDIKLTQSEVIALYKVWEMEW